MTVYRKQSTLLEVSAVLFWRYRRSWRRPRAGQCRQHGVYPRTTADGGSGYRKRDSRTGANTPLHLWILFLSPVTLAFCSHQHSWWLLFFGSPSVSPLLPRALWLPYCHTLSLFFLLGLLPFLLVALRLSPLVRRLFTPPFSVVSRSRKKGYGCIFLYIWRRFIHTSVMCRVKRRRRRNHAALLLLSMVPHFVLINRRPISMSLDSWSGLLHSFPRLIRRPEA